MTTASSSTRAYARFIPREEIGAVSEWQFRAVDEAAMRAAESLAAQDAAAEQAQRDQAWHEGHLAGVAKGRAQAMAEAQADAERRIQEFHSALGRRTAERMEALASGLQARLQEAEERIARDVLEMACSLARQVVRQELAGNPNAMLPVVREAVRMLLADGSTSVVRLHPDDLEVVERPLAEEFAGHAVRWLADPSVVPGDCLVESAGAVVDGGLRRRWTRAIANLGLDVPWQSADAGEGDGGP